MKQFERGPNMRCTGQSAGLLFICLLSALCAGVVGDRVPEAVAKTIYTYLDDQGNPMFTDNLDAVPARYRSKVKTIEQPTAEDAPVSFSQSIERRLRGHIRAVRSVMPTFHQGIPGLTPRQSGYVTYGGVLAIVLLIIMYLGKSPFTRLLGLALLLLMGIIMPVLMYISDDGPADRLQKAATTAGQAQQERLQQVSH